MDYFSRKGSGLVMGGNLRGHCHLVGCGKHNFLGNKLAIRAQAEELLKGL